MEVKNNREQSEAAEAAARHCHCGIAALHFHSACCRHCRFIRTERVGARECALVLGLVGSVGWQIVAGMIEGNSREDLFFSRYEQ